VPSSNPLCGNPACCYSNLQYICTVYNSEYFFITGNNSSKPSTGAMKMIALNVERNSHTVFDKAENCMSIILSYIALCIADLESHRHNWSPKLFENMRLNFEKVLNSLRCHSKYHVCQSQQKPWNFNNSNKYWDGIIWILHYLNLRRDATPEKRRSSPEVGPGEGGSLRNSWMIAFVDQRL
jgi:hypothetical protein